MITKTRPLRRSLRNTPLQPLSRTSPWPTTAEIIKAEDAHFRRIKANPHVVKQLRYDQALMEQLQRELNKSLKYIAKQAKANGKELVGGPLIQVCQTRNGQRIMSDLRELRSSLMHQRRELQLTPASNPENNPVVLSLKFPKLTRKQFQELVALLRTFKQ